MEIGPIYYPISKSMSNPAFSALLSDTGMRTQQIWEQAEQLADEGIVHFKHIKNFVAIYILRRWGFIIRIEEKWTQKYPGFYYMLDVPLSVVARRLERCKLEEELLL